MMTTTEAGTDRIEKDTILKAPRSRVWHALTDAREFGQWFKVELDGSFDAGKPTKGRITSKGFEHLQFEMQIERIEPEHLFSYRWHPYAVDPKRDYASEPTTLVEFRLDDVPGGTRLRVTESGFDRIPHDRRAEAFRMNDGGWRAQVENIRRHVEG